MTPQQAYQVLGVTPYSSTAEIQRAYFARLNQLQALGVPGQPKLVRIHAEQQKADLVDAYQLLMTATTAPPGSSSSPSPPPPAIPAFQLPRQAPAPSLPVSNKAMAASFLLAGGMVMLVLGMMFGPPLVSKARQIVTGDFRVLSVPWCRVELDGKDLGPSGQAGPFTVPAGKRKLVLQRNGKKITTTIDIPQDRLIFLKADFEKGVINVSSP